VSVTELDQIHGTPPPVTGRRPHEAQPRNRLFQAALLGCLVLALVFLIVLLTYLVVDGWPRLDSRLWTNQISLRRPENAGAQAAIAGTLWLMVFTALFCLPTGIMAAIYLEEYADKAKWFNRFIELNVQNLAAVPSVVFGILGLGILARQLGFGPTLLTGALTLSLLVLPVVIVSSREAIRAVPDSIRQGSMALGATKWQTVCRQVLPASIPGMATGSILALSRAIGEAAPLVIIGIPAFIAFNPAGLGDRFTALPIAIYNYARQPREEFIELASAISITLLVLLLVMNSLAIFIRNRYQRRW
jgi:phosphate transport system permease protein